MIEILNDPSALVPKSLEEIQDLILVCILQFSTVVVVVNCPPGATPPAIKPSNNTLHYKLIIPGFKFARAEYIAAVCAAGPEPIIITGCTGTSIWTARSLE